MIDYAKGLYFGFSLTADNYSHIAETNELLGADVFRVFEEHINYFITSETLSDIFVGIPVYDIEECEDVILSMGDINDVMNTEEFKKKAADFIEFCQKYIYPHTKQYCLPCIHLISMAW